MEVLPILSVEHGTSQKVPSNKTSSTDLYTDNAYTENSEWQSAVGLVSRRLETELRAAKSSGKLAAAEVLLPHALLPRIAADVLTSADSEPCGLRGCTLNIRLDTGNDNSTHVATVNCDPTTVSTFELYLTLKQDHTTWTSILPQFLKNLARGGTIMISSSYTLTKKKLYRSYQHWE